MDRARVLVVDDDTLSLRLLDRVLSQAGHEVVRAESGEAALERVRSQVFDAVSPPLAILAKRVPAAPSQPPNRAIAAQGAVVARILSDATPVPATTPEAH